MLYMLWIVHGDAEMWNTVFDKQADCLMFCRSREASDPGPHAIWFIVSERDAKKKGGE